MVVLSIIFGLYADFTSGLGLLDIVIDLCSGALQAFDLELQYTERRISLRPIYICSKNIYLLCLIELLSEPMGGNFQKSPVAAEAREPLNSSIPQSVAEFL